MIEGKWKYNGLKMLKEAQFLVASRRTHPFCLKFLPKKFKKKSEKFLKKIIKIDLNLPISATEIRKELKEGRIKKETKKFLPREIFNYIKKNKLYL